METRKKEQNIMVNKDGLQLKIRAKILLLIVTIIFVLLSNVGICYADLEDKEEIDLEEIQKEVAQVSKAITEEPKLNAKIGLVFDRASKTILYEKNGLKQVPMASTTKIMTAIVVLENADLTDVVTIEKKAAGTGGSRLGLKVNDKITVHDLLYGLMLKSGNDTAVALAIHVGGSVEGFAEIMNKTAQEMGWVNSHFITPHGLDAKGHYTTAYELACMADYALQNPKFKEIVSTKTYTVTINGRPQVISNTNELLGYLDGVYGVKTGFTNGANRCLVTACKRGDFDIITVVLGADTKKIRTQDSISLIEYTHKNYQVVNLEEIIKEKFENWKQLNERRIYINKGKTNQIHIQLEEMSYKTMTIKNTEVDNIELEMNSLYYLQAPVQEKQTIGNVKVYIKDKTIGTLNIQNQKVIEKKGIKDYFMDFLSLLP
ncbi:MAG: D-alanyl-D-alanine carboxypeptidase [Clostridia bacterium]|nr:D-alanyl-D-alanine carboxypeptidase [Clostridia bacterium]